ncbi:MAG: hypothetical protein PHH37_02330 [Paludibacter sp.]|nr:hypothetical protein [Paludibacter sp.]
MTDFQLYRKRDFSALLNDTLEFVKLNGKNYFKNFLFIVAPLLMIFALIYFFTFKDVLNNIATGKNPSTLFSDNNLGVMIIFGILLFIVSIILSIASTGFPVVYLNLYEKNENTNFPTSEILNNLTNHAGKIIIFGLSSFFLFLIPIVIFLALSIVLIVLLVGIPLLIIGLPAIGSWMYLSLIVYLREDLGFFESLGKGWKILFSNFWAIVGSMVIIMLVTVILQSIVSVVPMMFGMGSFITSGGNPANFNMPTLNIIIYIISIFLSYFLNNLLLIQQMLAYFSGQENSEHINAISEIDSIGNNAE